MCWSSIPKAAELLERIPVGKRPRGLHLSNDGTHAVSSRCQAHRSPHRASMSRSCRLPIGPRTASASSISRAASWRARCRRGQDPEAFDLSPDGRTLYLSNEETAEMSALDLASGTIRGKVKVGEEPEGVTVPSRTAGSCT